MSGKYESKLERILKPIRINPLASLLAIGGFGAAAIFGLFDDSLMRAAAYANCGVGGVGVVFYACSLMDYFKFRSDIRSNGFSFMRAQKRMRHYCDRHPFYVACIENGYRKEFEHLTTK